MEIREIIDQYFSSPGKDQYQLLDKHFLPLDRNHIRRTRNIRLIPHESDRRGGKYSYAEWAYVIGIFQTLMYVHLDKKQNNEILDVGGGTGLLGIASLPFLGPTGKYVGIDVKKCDVDFCRSHYPALNFRFIHLDVHNPIHAPAQTEERVRWPVDDHSFDLVTALSVWTHFKEEDAKFYFEEVGRVLKPGAKAIITFFVIDDIYKQSLAHRSGDQGQFHTKPQDKYIFDQPAYGSEAWFHARQARVPENCIGLTWAGLNLLTASAQLDVLEHYQGTWKEIPGVFLQDVLVFGKA